MPEPGMPHYRILCIDDHEDTCLLLTALLPGYDVLTASSFNQAVRMIEKQSFDLYLLDNWLGDGSGVQLCHYIQTTYPDKPVIFCSAAGFERDKEEAFAAGARAYLVKPIEPDLLRQTIKQQ